MIVHFGAGIPSFRESWDPSDIDYVWFAWDDKLNGATITNSEWTLPTGFSLISEQQDASVTDEDGVTYSNANGAMISTTLTSGRQIVANKVTLSDGRVYERSCRFRLKQL